KVAIIAINRPEDNNRVNSDACDELVAAFRSADKDAAVHAVVLTGRNGTFCEGGRIDGYPGGTVMTKKRFANAYLGVQRAIWDAAKPVIAAVNGKALAGGFALVECCDLAIAGEGSSFGLPELRRGNFPMLALANMQKGLPKKKLFEIVYRGSILDAATAKEWDLVNLVVPDGRVLDTAVEWAADIAEQSLVAASFGREAYYKMINMDYIGSLEYAKNALIALTSTEDSQEVDRALREGRKPEFKGY
ncbi:MAG: enoyl-CoA hydratase/isomerase family protein, partial [Planctomycetota bacterium]|nr:enoyl-CoA hydratase/isomerase family protein [Planctomycetota bacterium]